MVHKCLTRFCSKWISPIGYDIGVKIYNCITKQKEWLIVPNKSFVTWYTCGPTVYDFAHLGHASCYMKVDILQNILRKYFGLNIITFMNVTDIDDKIINKSNITGESCSAIANRFELEFWNDLSALGISKPHFICKVTEQLPIIIEFIKDLIGKGYAYKDKDNSIYFCIEKYHRYGKLVNTSNMDELYGKERKDFVLWKADDRKPSWNSPWGPGRPGWHVECSAIAGHFLGTSIDFHAGGLDLKFPHHENEEAQSCARYGVDQWVNYWIHIGHLHQKNNEKMSKSLQNSISISHLLKNHSSQTFRLACSMSHYRSPMEYSEELMITAQRLFLKYKNFLDYLSHYLAGTVIFYVDPQVFTQLLTDLDCKTDEYLRDDFNTSAIINLLTSIVSAINTSKPASHDDVRHPLLVQALHNKFLNVLQLLGIDINIHSFIGEKADCSEIVRAFNTFRQNVRNLAIDNKNNELIKLCDNARNDLKKCGISVKDHGKVSTWCIA